MVLCLSYGFSQSDKKVLFIGNSYTGANNLPLLISELANDAGNGISTDQHIPGGSQLSQHAVNSTALNKIASEKWDFVVLQDQSQKPSFPYQQVQNDVYPYAEILVDSIYSNDECSTPLFYGTWGRQNGDPQWDSISTFQKMNTRLFNAYSHMASEAEGMLSPVGIGFAHVHQDPSGVVSFGDLYTGDGSHPTIKGSYLAACIFNNLIFETVSTGNNYLPNGMNTAEANYLQGVADHVVYDVDSVQVDFKPNLTNNDFSFTLVEETVSLTPNVVEGTFDYWDFGDGQISTQENATHTYIDNGTYELKMFTKARCQSDSSTQQVIINTLNLLDEKIQSINVYPNPSEDGMLNIQYQGKEDFKVISVLGEIVFSGNSNQIELKSGLYFIHFNEQVVKVVVK